MAQCFHPFFVDAPSGSRNEKHPVPCGKCPPCLQRRASAWSFRLLNEMDREPRCFFVTLTYENPPMSPKGFMTLSKRDFQLFMKRLRKLSPPVGRDSFGTATLNAIRYYAVGEYGSIRMRPHFHAIMYGVNPDLILKAWPYGIIEVDPDVNPANIAYVCKYITKGRLVPAHKNDDRVPEFSLMSKNLGSSYLTPQMKRYHKADLSRSYATLEGGVKISLPRYYKDRIFSPEEREFMFFTNQDDFSTRFAKEMEEYIKRKSEAEFYNDRHYAILQSENLFFKTALISREDL